MEHPILLLFLHWKFATCTQLEFAPNFVTPAFLFQSSFGAGSIKRPLIALNPFTIMQQECYKSPFLMSCIKLSSLSIFITKKRCSYRNIVCPFFFLKTDLYVLSEIRSVVLDFGKNKIGNFLVFAHGSK